jgi:methionyl-tRNA formyltransferase
MSLSVLFAGNPAIAVPSLEAAAALEREGVLRLAAVLTNADAARGRSGRPEATDVARSAREMGAVLLQPERLDGSAREAAAATGANLLASFAYGRIFGPKFLGLFPRGGINVHPSLLPRHRGPAPVQAAILAGDAETGVTVQKIALETDAGEILAQERIPLSGRETGGSLGEAAAARGAALLAGVLRLYAQCDGAGTVPAGHPQQGEISYSALASRKDALLDWSLGALEIDRQIRAWSPPLACYTRHGAAELYILEGRPLPSGAASGSSPPAGTVLGTDRDAGILIQTGKGVYAASRLQYRAKKALDWKAFLNGARNFTGARLG